MRQLILLLGLLTLPFITHAQVPINNNCTGAINIPIGTPPPCGSGVQQSTISTVVGNITNATPGNPYIYQPNCSGAGGPLQSIAANDVWYSFVATGYQANITINSSFANPNIAFYSGNCAALGGGIGGCAVGTGGNVSLTVNQMVPGTTYFLQVSGNVGQVGTFTMGINNVVDCQDCLQTTTITVNPPPVNGAYAPNTTVNVCLHIGSYKTINTNWLHGVQLTFGSGWNPASVVPNVPLPISTAGTWAYYPAGIGLNNAVNWGPGWYFDFAPQDANPRNNFGDSNSGGVPGFLDTSTPAQWNFCVSLTTNAACTPGSNLNVTFNTSGDGESGSWNNAGCSTDAAVVFNAVGACCPPIMSSLPVSCFSTSTGSATATPVGASGPYNYTWSGPSGFTSTTNSVIAANTISNVPAGIYTVTIVNSSLCAVSSTVQVTQPTSLTAVTSATNAGCSTNGTASVVVAGGTGSYTYTWAPSGGNAPSVSVPQGIYTVTAQDSKLCTRIATVNVGFTGTVSAAFTIPTPTQCLNGNSFTFNAANSLGTHSYSFNPIVGSPVAGGTATYGPVSFTSPGTYSVVHSITVGLCTANATSVVVINPMPTPIIGNNGPVCPGSNLVLSSGGGTSYAWNGPNLFASAIQNPTITGASATQAGVYTVTVTALGCSSTATTNVVVSAPTVTASNTGSYCAGSTIQLNSTAASSYSWTGPNGFLSNAQNPSIVNSTTVMAGTYSLIVSIGSCTVLGNTSVVVAALPNPNIVHNAPICVGQTLTLNGSGGVSYQWNGPSAFSNASQNVSITPVALTNAGVYSLTVTDANNCIRTGTANIVINPLPTPIIGNNGPVCPGSNLVLNSGGGTSYAWNGPNLFASAIQNPTIAGVSATQAGVYTVTVTALGCSSTATTNVVVSVPTVTASNTGSYCAGSAIQLNSTAASSYSWTGPNGFLSNAQNPSIVNSTTVMAGTYSLIVSIGSCTILGNTSVVVAALPNPNIVHNAPICVGQTLTLNGSGGVSYQWNGPSAFNNASQNVSITPVALTNAGVYSLTVTDANNCSQTGTANVIVNPLPVAIANSNGTVCPGANILLTSGGGTSYAWIGPNGFISVIQNPTITPAVLVSAGVYSVTATALGCSSTATTNLIVNIPTTSAGNTGSYCAGSTIQLNTPAGAGFIWSGPNGFSSVAQNPTILGASVNAGGNYTVIASIAGCSAVATTSVVVNALPIPIIGSNGPVCLGSDIILNSGGGNAYQWSGPSLFTSALQNPTITAAGISNSGVYTVTVTDANICSNTITLNVQVNPLPNAGAVGTVVCTGNNAGLTAIGGTSYSWIGPNGFSSVIQNPVIVSSNTTHIGQYTVTVTDANTCTNTALASIMVNPSPTLAISGVGATCLNSLLSYTVQGNGTYQWTGPNNFSSSAPTITINANSLSVGGQYSVSVTSINGCRAGAITNATIYPLPPVNISSDVRTGCVPLCSNFTVTSNTPIQTFGWDLNDGLGSVSTSSNASGCYLTAGIYTVVAQLTNTFGCRNSGTYTVQAYPRPVADYVYQSTKPIANVSSNVQFTDVSNGANVVAWSWDFTNTGTYLSTQQHPSYNYTEAGDYYAALVVTSDRGCRDTVMKRITVGEDFGIWIPNTFTPDGSGVNDTFQPKGFGIVSYEVSIYDRWGEILYKGNNFNQGWDGMYKDEMCKTDVYVYRILITNVYGKSLEYVGHVNLIR